MPRFAWAPEDMGENAARTMLSRSYSASEQHGAPSSLRVQVETAPTKPPRSPVPGGRDLRGMLAAQFPSRIPRPTPPSRYATPVPTAPSEAAAVASKISSVLQEKNEGNMIVQTRAKKQLVSTDLAPELQLSAECLLQELHKKEHEVVLLRQAVSHSGLCISSPPAVWRLTSDKDKGHESEMRKDKMTHIPSPNLKRSRRTSAPGQHGSHSELAAYVLRVEELQLELDASVAQKEDLQAQMLQAKHSSNLARCRENSLKEDLELERERRRQVEQDLERCRMEAHDTLPLERALAKVSMPVSIHRQHSLCSALESEASPPPDQIPQTAWTSEQFAKALRKNLLGLQASPRTPPLSFRRLSPPTPPRTPPPAVLSQAESLVFEMFALDQPSHGDNGKCQAVASNANSRSPRSRASSSKELFSASAAPCPSASQPKIEKLEMRDELAKTEKPMLLALNGLMPSFPTAELGTPRPASASTSNRRRLTSCPVRVTPEHTMPAQSSNNSNTEDIRSSDEDGSSQHHQFSHRGSSPKEEFDSQHKLCSLPRPQRSGRSPTPPQNTGTPRQRSIGGTVSVPSPGKNKDVCRSCSAPNTPWLP